jgi:hypothetical protein
MQPFRTIVVVGRFVLKAELSTRTVLAELTVFPVLFEQSTALNAIILPVYIPPCDSTNRVYHFTQYTLTHTLSHPPLSIDL